MIETLQQFVTIGLRKVLFGDGAGDRAQTLFQPRPPLGRIQRLGVALAGEQHVHEGCAGGELGLQGRRPLFAQDIVGILAADDGGEAEALAGLEQRQGAVDGSAGGLLARPVAVEAQRRLRVQAPEHFHLRLAQRRAHGRHGGDPGPLAGNDVHVTLDHDQGRAIAAGVQQLARLRQAVEHVALVEERRVGAVEVLGPGLRIHGPPAEGDDPPSPVGDRKDDPVAEAVVGRTAVLGRD